MMIFHRTEIQGACFVELEKRVDERGFFARAWCRQEFSEQGLCNRLVQMNISFNRYKHTLRGFHYQVAPYQEDKLLRCVRGAAYDVMIDLRPESPSYLRHIALELTAENYLALLVPKGCANAFLTLEDNTEATYLVSEYYSLQAERGARWDDPAFGIHWPAEPALISKKDREWPDFRPEHAPTWASAYEE